MGSQFSNSNPSITITANNVGVFPGHIAVGQYSWGSSGSPNNLGNGYWSQRYTYLANQYVVNSNPTVQFVFGAGAGSCASYVFSRSILVVS